MGKHDNENQPDDDLNAKRASVVDADVQDHRTAEADAMAAAQVLNQKNVKQGLDFGVRERMGSEDSTGITIRGAGSAQIEKEQQEKKKKETEFHRALRQAAQYEQALMDRFQELNELALKLLAEAAEHDDRAQELLGIAGDLQDLEDDIKKDGMSPDEKEEAKRRIQLARKKMGMDDVNMDNMSDAQLLTLLTQTKLELIESGNHEHDQAQKKNDAASELEKQAKELADKLEAIQNDPTLSDEDKEAACKALIDEAENRNILDEANRLLNSEQVKTLVANKDDIEKNNEATIDDANELDFIAQSTPPPKGMDFDF